MFRDIKIWARRLIRDAHAVYLAACDPGVPWYAKILAATVAAAAIVAIWIGAAAMLGWAGFTRWRPSG